MKYYSAIKKEWNLAICNIDGPRAYYAKWSELDTERQVPYDFAYLWSLRNKTNKTETETDL